MRFSVSIIALMFIIGCPSRETHGVVESDVAQPAEDIEEAIEEVEEEVQEDLGSPPECATSEDCEDYVECTKNVCNYGKCQFQPNAEYCKDSDECTIELCNPKGNVFGGCEYKAKPCDDGDDCTSDSCDKTQGCVFAMDGGVCKDSNPCTEDLCELNGCAHVPMNCDDEDPGTFDGCSNQSGCYHYTKECGEGFPCKHSDPCMVSTCNPDFTCSHEMKVCKDDVACTFDVCNGGECVFKPKGGLCPASGNKCVASFCDPMFGCTFGDIECDDGKPYTFDYCDPDLGCVFDNTGEWCEPGTNQCEDGDPCTYDVCQPDNTCSYLPKVCNDNIACTVDVCVGDGECVGIPDNELCENGLKCNKDAGKCTPCVVGADCDDENPCTYDYCDNVGGKMTTGTWECKHDSMCGVDECDTETGVCIEPEYWCQIDLECEQPDDPCAYVKCEENECIYGGFTNGEICHEDECSVSVCNIMSECVIDVEQECGDGNSCTDDLCDPKVGCMYLESEDGTLCNDGNWCTKEAKCSFGFCIQKEVKNCNDGDPCTVDSCGKDVGCVNDFSVEICVFNQCVNENIWGCEACAGAPACNDGEDVTEDVCTGFDIPESDAQQELCVHKVQMSEGVGWICFNIPTYAEQEIDGVTAEAEEFPAGDVVYHWQKSNLEVWFQQFLGTGIPPVEECACINQFGLLTMPTLLIEDEDLMVMKCSTDTDN